jgi:multisubunit Na+/H+ antiporter MnhC subunit
MSVGSQLGDGRVLKKIISTTIFEHAVGIFVNGINTILEEYVPRVKESPYVKR